MGAGICSARGLVHDEEQHDVGKADPTHAHLGRFPRGTAVTPAACNCASGAGAAFETLRGTTVWVGSDQVGRVVGKGQAGAIIVRFPGDRVVECWEDEVEPVERRVARSKRRAAARSEGRADLVGEPQLAVVPP